MQMKRLLQSTSPGLGDCRTAIVQPFQFEPEREDRENNTEELQMKRRPIIRLRRRERDQSTGVCVAVACQLRESAGFVSAAVHNRNTNQTEQYSDPIFTKPGRVWLWMMVSTKQMLVAPHLPIWRSNPGPEVAFCTGSFPLYSTHSCCLPQPKMHICSVLQVNPPFSERKQPETTATCFCAHLCLLPEAHERHHPKIHCTAKIQATSVYYGQPVVRDKGPFK